MTDDDMVNPYGRPETDSVSRNTRRSPGPLAIVGIIIVTLVATGCAFFCSCIGLFVAVEEVNSLRSMGPEGLLIACTFIAIGCGAFVAWGMTKIIRKASGAAKPRPDQQGPAE